MRGHRSPIFITFIFLLGIMKVYTQSDFVDQKVSSDLNGAGGIEFVHSRLCYV